MTGSDFLKDHGGDSGGNASDSGPQESGRALRDDGSADFGVDGDMVRGRLALVIIVVMVWLADTCIYHTQGFTGPAVFFVGAAALFVLGIPKRAVTIQSGLFLALLLWCSWRLVCNGDGLLIASGLWLMHAFVLALRRQVPYVLETLIFAAQSIPGGYEFVAALNRRVHDKVLDPAASGKSFRLLNIGLPVFSAFLFGSIFVLANPDVVQMMSGTLNNLVEHIRRFLFHFSLLETVFWAIVAWFTGGLLRPVVSGLIGEESNRDADDWVVAEVTVFDAFRNTLLTVIAMFSVYLIFEFSTLWFREFPEGFHYSGYAHQGAAWLTVALGLATVMLSLIFRGATLADPRLKQLTRLAWIWSALNFVLAIAVYHRMQIYVDFNGMTRMRVVGLLGITSVVGGFALVMFKISGRRNFLWLIRRQLWVLASACFLYAALPVDVLIHRYNVRQILSGNHAPVVQITQHAVDDEALPVLIPLVESEDERIREGIQAMLETRLTALVKPEESESDWTAWQKSEADSLTVLGEAAKQWQSLESDDARQLAFKRLKTYAYSNWW